MNGILFAQTAPATPISQAPGGSIVEMVLPLLLMFLVFYFLLIRPQQKRAKEHQQLLKNIKKDDEVVTASGVYGVITGLTDTIVTLEIANNVKIKMDRNQIVRVVKGV